MVVVSRSHLGVVLKDSRVRNCSQHSELPEVSLPSYLVYMGRDCLLYTSDAADEDSSV